MQHFLSTQNCAVGRRLHLSHGLATAVHEQVEVNFSTLVCTHNTYTTLEGYEKGGFTAKTLQLFSFRSQYAREIKKRNDHQPVSLDLCLRNTWSGKSQDYRGAIAFGAPFSKCVPSTRERKTGVGFQTSPVL